MYILEYSCLLESMSGCAAFSGAVTDTSFPKLLARSLSRVINIKTDQNFAKGTRTRRFEQKEQGLNNSFENVTSTAASVSSLADRELAGDSRGNIAFEGTMKSFQVSQKYKTTASMSERLIDEIGIDGVI